MDLVLKLRELRNLRGLSQKDVSRRSGVGEKTISSFETGQRIGTMKLSQLAKLLAIYGVTEEQFFSRAIEELFDPDAISRRSREEQLIAGLQDLAADARNALLERFELMLDSALTVRGPASGSIRLATPRPSATTHHASAA
ncbi:MAG: helix-turn-helix protein [Thermoanaerobaculia bacterium]|jgi:transcriptional regulator with XRE-family HTH domain|nr:helix-turn-helix protein [Thermoanaerobaculia bacterium]